MKKFGTKIWVLFAIIIMLTITTAWAGIRDRFSDIELNDMYATTAELDQFVLVESITDVSTSGSFWVVSPYSGTIEAIYTVIKGTIATANAGLTFEIGGVAVTGGGITIAYSGSAAGDVDSSTPTAARIVTAGQPIEIITDGASTNSIRTTVTIVMRHL